MSDPIPILIDLFDLPDRVWICYGFVAIEDLIKPPIAGFLQAFVEDPAMQWILRASSHFPNDRLEVIKELLLKRGEEGNDYQVVKLLSCVSQLV